MQPQSNKNRPFDSWDALKILALFLMFIDHSGHFFYHDEKWLRAIGRGAAPIFLFLTGFAVSYRFKWDLFALAVLMSISDFLLTGHLRTQNILVTILGCRMIFAWLEWQGKKIERPWEWYVGCLGLFMTIVIAQYGSIGMLFAVSGYLKRRSRDYPPKLPERFLITSFVTYACYTQLFTQFSIPDLLLMVVTLVVVWRLLERFSIHELRPGNVPRSLLRAGKFISCYSGYIYAFHEIALEWISGTPF